MSHPSVNTQSMASVLSPLQLSHPGPVNTGTGVFRVGLQVQFTFFINVAFRDGLSHTALSQPFEAASSSAYHEWVSGGEGWAPKLQDTLGTQFLSEQRDRGVGISIACAATELC
ncbi:hypothetical protein FOBRF1_003785 [Fusarium oxysporum]